MSGVKGMRKGIRQPKRRKRVSERMRCPVCGMLVKGWHFQAEHKYQRVRQHGLGRGRGFRTEYIGLRDTEYWDLFVLVIVEQLKRVYEDITGERIYTRQEVDDARLEGRREGVEGGLGIPAEWDMRKVEDFKLYPKVVGIGEDVKVELKPVVRILECRER